MGWPSAYHTIITFKSLFLWLGIFGLGMTITLYGFLRKRFADLEIYQAHCRFWTICGVILVLPFAYDVAIHHITGLGLIIPVALIFFLLAGTLCPATYQYNNNHKIGDIIDPILLFVALVFYVVYSYILYWVTLIIYNELSIR